MVVVCTSNVISSSFFNLKSVDSDLPTGLCCYFCSLALDFCSSSITRRISVLSWNNMDIQYLLPSCLALERLILSKRKTRTLLVREPLYTMCGKSYFLMIWKLFTAIFCCFIFFLWVGDVFDYQWTVDIKE